ncbi:MAG: hypothetical protein KA015_00745 [Spirochaetes bacterium]|nr:hypothetical protein [Spirochaetota bacterium]
MIIIKKLTLFLFIVSGLYTLNAAVISVSSQDKPSAEKRIKDNIEKIGIKTNLSIRINIYKFSSQSEVFSVKNDNLSIEKGIIEINALMTVVKDKKPYSMHIIKSNGKNENEAVSELLKNITLILAEFK